MTALTIWLVFSLFSPAGEGTTTRAVRCDDWQCVRLSIATAQTEGMYRMVVFDHPPPLPELWVASPPVADFRFD